MHPALSFFKKKDIYKYFVYLLLHILYTKYIEMVDIKFYFWFYLS